MLDNIWLQSVSNFLPNASKPDELLNKVRHTAKNTEDKNEATCQKYLYCPAAAPEPEEKNMEQR